MSWHYVRTGVIIAAASLVFVAHAPLGTSLVWLALCAGAYANER